jgi:hypothetical protein
MATIKLRYVNAFANKDRADKRLRYFFRKRGQKAIPLPGVPGSEAFMEAYTTALAGLPDAQIEIGARRTGPGTVDALCTSYYKSGEWTGLAEDTRDARRRIIEKFRAQHGTKRVRLISEAHLVAIMNKITSLSSRRSWLKAIKHLLQHAVPIMRKDNPAEKIAQVKLPKSKGHWAWTDDQITAYRTHWKLGTKQRLVFEFALETVSRRGEARSSALVRSIATSEATASGGSGSSARMAPAMSISRYRTRWQPQSTRCHSRPRSTALCH